MRVREPIQVYLSEEERADLDRAAREQGISRSEALRRALRALTSSGEAGGLHLARVTYVTPALAPPGPPPPRKPVTRLEELLTELADDRSDR